MIILQSDRLREQEKKILTKKRLKNFVNFIEASRPSEVGWTEIKVKKATQGKREKLRPAEREREIRTHAERAEHHSRSLSMEELQLIGKPEEQQLSSVHVSEREQSECLGG